MIFQAVDREPCAVLVEDRLDDYPLIAQHAERQVDEHRGRSGCRRKRGQDPHRSDEPEVPRLSGRSDLVPAFDLGGPAPDVVALADVFDRLEATWAHRVRDPKDVGSLHRQVNGPVATHRVAGDGSSFAPRFGSVLPVDVGRQVVCDETGPAAAHRRVAVEPAAQMVAAVGHDDDRGWKAAVLDHTVEDRREAEVINPYVGAVEDPVEQVYDRIALACRLVVTSGNVDEYTLLGRVTDQIASQRRRVDDVSVDPRSDRRGDLRMGRHGHTQRERRG